MVWRKFCLLLFVVCLLFSTTEAYGELFVIYDSDTKAIYSVSEKGDTVIPEGMEQKVLSGKFSDYSFSENLTNCKFIKGKFIVDNDRINKEYQRVEKRKKQKEDEKKIQDRIREIAIRELEEEGIL